MSSLLASSVPDCQNGVPAASRASIWIHIWRPSTYPVGSLCPVRLVTVTAAEMVPGVGSEAVRSTSADSFSLLMARVVTVSYSWFREGGPKW